MAATAQGATFSFAGSRGTISGGVTKISVEAPTAEVVDVTGMYDPVDSMVMVPTGAWRGGSVNVEVLASGTADSLLTAVRGVGSLSFTSSGFSVSRRAVLESASASVAVGDVVRASLKFVMTDWYGS